MKWKYMMIFLMGLLCLVSSDNLFSQHCFTMSYDKNGNRINFMSVSCSKNVRGNINDKAEESERYEKERYFRIRNHRHGSRRRRDWPL